MPDNPPRIGDIEQQLAQNIVVLLVDDQAIIGEAVRRMLVPHEDITFHFCQDPREALARAAEVQPTVILQDLVMPEINGLDLVPQYRAAGRHGKYAADCVEYQRRGGNQGPGLRARARTITWSSCPISSSWWPAFATIREAISVCCRGMPPTT